MMKRIKKILAALKPKRGFTLIEILIAVVISFIIMAAVFEVFIAQRKRYVTEDAILEVENSGHFSIEYLTRIVQNSGYNIKSGMKIESASDHYFTSVMDENDNGYIEANEVVTITVNTPYREIGEDETPTEIVHDPDLNAEYGNPNERYFDFYFDMDGDGVVEETDMDGDGTHEGVTDSERFESGYNLDDAADDDAPDQMDTIKLYLKSPPYALYRYIYVLEDEEAAFDPVNNPYIVYEKPDLITDNVDNFIIRYYDEEDMPLPVATDSSGNRITPKPPYVLTRGEMGKIRRVEFELLLTTAREDPKWTDNGKYPVGSVATYDNTGKPVGWSCNDSGYPPSPQCDGLTSWDCFLMYCDDKIYTGGEFVPYEDHYRRILLTASATPKNLILNPYGSLFLESIPKVLRCPDNEVEITATLKDREGAPIANAVVNFYSTALVSEFDFSTVSNTDAEGNPITDAEGHIDGIKLRPAAPAGEKKKPVTVTVSADSTITVNVDGVDKEFPVYSSVVVPFIVGPPSTLTFENPPTYVLASCKITNEQPLIIYAEDCNSFEVEGAKVEMNFYDPDNYDPDPDNDPTTSPPALPTLSNTIDPGSFFIFVPDVNDDDGDGDTEEMIRRYQSDAADYSILSADRGKYLIYYEPPLVDTPPEITYLRSLGIIGTATKFQDKVLDEAEPDGWGMSFKPSDWLDSSIVLTPGLPSTLSFSPANFSDSGCRGNDTYITALGYDCGGYESYYTVGILEYDVKAIIEDAEFGRLEDLSENPLPEDHSPESPPDLMEWVGLDLLFKARYLVFGCANSDIIELIEVYLKDNPTIGGQIEASLSQCPIGLNINISAKEPHTGDLSDPEGWGDGDYTDGFFQDGCDYDNLDIVARVILNLPPAIECEDVTFNPVDFQIESGDARFYNSVTGDYDSTNVTVNTDNEGVAIVPIMLTSNCSLTDVEISAYSTYGTDPEYSATENITLEVVQENILFAYRDYCYTDRLTPSNPLWNGDQVYIEVRDCCSDITTIPDDVLVKTYEWIGPSFADEENFYIDETDNESGVFRGRVRTEALPINFTSTDEDGILHMTNGGHFNALYWDAGGLEHMLFEGPFVQTIMDLCETNIKFVEAFSEKWFDEDLDGIYDENSDGTNDVLQDTFFPMRNWNGFSGRAVTFNSTYDPIEGVHRSFIIQNCDKLLMSSPIPLRDFTEPMNPSLPANLPLPTTAIFKDNELLCWVDLNDDDPSQADYVGEEGSELVWDDYDFSVRFRYLDESPETSGLSGSDSDFPDYYFPGIERGIAIMFRLGFTTEEMTGLPGSPEITVANHGYMMVWTEDSGGDPLLKMLRIDGVDGYTNPVTVNHVQLGADVTYPDFDTHFDDGFYHKVEFIIEDEKFYINIDDYSIPIDFDGSGGASATDMNYTAGTVGFGVKNAIVVFDNLQICGCPPLEIEPETGAFDEDVSETLELKNIISGSLTGGPVTWVVDPADSGYFDGDDDNTSPYTSSDAQVDFTRESGKPFPSFFEATDFLGCFASLFPIPPTLPCFTDDFETPPHTLNLPAYGWIQIEGGGVWYIRSFTYEGSPTQVLISPDSSNKIVVLDNPEQEPSWKTSTDINYNGYDNYEMWVDIWIHDDDIVVDNYSDGGGHAGVVVRYTSERHYYTVTIRNEEPPDYEDGGYEIRLAEFNVSWIRRDAVELDTADLFLSNEKYTLYVKCENNSIYGEVFDSGGNSLGSVSWTDPNDRFPTGNPGFRWNVTFTHDTRSIYDNFKVCPLPPP